MAFIAAKCTQCGANIQVDKSKDAGICPHCGTAFVTEKAINNYNVNYNVTKVITNQKEEANDLIEDGIALYDLKQYKKALKIFRKVTGIEPKDFRGWYYTAKILKENLWDYNDDDDTAKYEMLNAIDVAYDLAKDGDGEELVKSLYTEIYQEEIESLRSSKQRAEERLAERQREKAQSIATAQEELKKCKQHYLFSWVNMGMGGIIMLVQLVAFNLVFSIIALILFVAALISLFTCKDMRAAKAKLKSLQEKDDLYTIDYDEREINHCDAFLSNYERRLNKVKNKNDNE